MNKTIRSVQELMRFMAKDGRLDYYRSSAVPSAYVYHKGIMSTKLDGPVKVDFRIATIALNQGLLRQVRQHPSWFKRRYMLSKKGREIAGVH